eukprot:TRINITY_DN33041_c0_g1_i1.p1 TRINITY_DN33041_c0_g1~~TRINITY_DN33041_c0_g1_i1.p1  ORF type:complete len:205 (+),score=43.89 TRINITY_DN33041_c0_g1_i1:102-716(+)
MRRSFSRSKYLGPQAPGAASPASQSAGHSVDRRGAGHDEELPEAGRLRRQETRDPPKRLSPLDSVPGRLAAARCPWPSLEVSKRDWEVARLWQQGVEDVLSQSTQDSACSFRFLMADEHYLHSGTKKSPWEVAAERLNAPWNFQKFIQESDYPNDSQYEEWQQAMQERCAARRQPAGGAQLTLVDVDVLTISAPPAGSEQGLLD